MKAKSALVEPPMTSELMNIKNPANRSDDPRSPRGPVRRSRLRVQWFAGWARLYFSIYDRDLVRANRPRQYPSEEFRRGRRGSFDLFLILLILLFAGGCNPSGNGGLISVAVKNATRPASLSADANLPEPLRVASFRVAVFASDMAPIEVTFPGDAAGGTVSGIPVGDNRTVLVEALNAQGRVVRRREIQGVKIGKGEPTPVIAALLSVPLVISPGDGNLVTQTRLVFKGYAEPGGSLEIQEVGDTAAEGLLTDISTADHLISPSLSDGGFVFQPGVLPLGPHTFVVRDPSSGEETRVFLTLVRPGRMPGTGIGTAGSFKAASDISLGHGGRFLEALREMRKH